MAARIVRRAGDGAQARQGASTPVCREFAADGAADSRRDSEKCLLYICPLKAILRRTGIAEPVRQALTGLFTISGAVADNLYLLYLNLYPLLGT